jgi:hypothetical protein
MKELREACTSDSLVDRAKKAETELAATKIEVIVKLEERLENESK